MERSVSPVYSAHGPARPSIFPLLLLASLAVAAAAIGFGAFLYSVPYKRLLAERQQRATELRQVQGRLQELERGKAAAAGAAEAAGVRFRSEMTVLKSQIEAQLGASGVTVTVEPHRLRVSFPEDAIFGSRGPWLSKGGQELLTSIVPLIGDRAGRLVVSAPMGGAPIAKWVRPDFPTAGDLSAARASNALKALAKAGVQVERVFAVIATVVAPGDASAPATLDLELEPT